jgi:hypothetical protein
MLLPAFSVPVDSRRFSAQLFAAPAAPGAFSQRWLILQA